MIIDIHTHIFPDRIAEKTMAALSEIAGVKPFHNGAKSGLLKVMEEAGIDISVVLPVATKPSQFRSINQFAAEVTEDFRGKERRLISFGGIHPDSSDYRDEIRHIRDLGLPGIKLHPAYQMVPFSDLRYRRIMDFAFEQDLWVIVHSGWDPVCPDEDYCTPKETAQILDDMDGGKLILAHMGALSEWDDVERYLVGRNVWIDTSLAFAYMEREQIVRIIRNHGFDRVLFGSDCPWADMKSSVEGMLSLPFTEEERDRIMYKNALQIIGTR